MFLLYLNTLEVAIQFHQECERTNLSQTNLTLKKYFNRKVILFLEFVYFPKQD